MPESVLDQFPYQKSMHFVKPDPIPHKHLRSCPHIDRLAKEGTRFANAFVSQSICWVSRTTILTGLTGRSYGVPGNHDMARPEAVEKLYTDLLMEAGYRTGFAGKWHAKMPKGWKAQDHFDEFHPIGRNPFYKKQEDGSLRHETELIVDRGIKFLENQPKDKPFALNVVQCLPCGRWGQAPRHWPFPLASSHGWYVWRG